MTEPGTDSATPAVETPVADRVGVAVVIPVRDRVDVVGDAVRSVLDQWVAGTELVVVDDGSSDGTADAVEALGDARVRVERRPPEGVSAARNHGVRCATNGWIVFLDSDDVALDGWLAAMCQAANRGVDLFSCAATLTHTDGGTRTQWPRQYGAAFGSLHALFRAGTFAIRRDRFDDAGGYRPGLRHGENSDLGMRLGELAMRTPLSVEWTDVPLVRIITRDRPYDAALQYESAMTMLTEAEHLLALDRRLLADYAAIGGVAASRSGRRREALQLLVRAVRTDPRRPKHVARLARAAVARPAPG